MDEANEEISQPRACIWCSKPMPSDFHESISVCWRCQQLLRNAGISEEEIFGNEELQKQFNPDSTTPKNHSEK